MGFLQLKTRSYNEKLGNHRAAVALGLLGKGGIWVLTTYKRVGYFPFQIRLETAREVSSCNLDPTSIRCCSFYLYKVRGPGRSPGLPSPEAACCMGEEGLGAAGSRAGGKRAGWVQPPEPENRREGP